MTIPEEMDIIAERICTEYCKYPEEYESSHEDMDEATQKLLDEKCSKCPLMRLV